MEKIMYITLPIQAALPPLPFSFPKNKLCTSEGYASNGICEGFCIFCCMSIELWKKKKELWKKSASDNLTTLVFTPDKIWWKKSFFSP